MKITDIKDKIVTITSENYENIFNIFTDENDFYYYNLLKKVDFPDDLDPLVYDWYQCKGGETYPNIAFNYYGSVVLWWIIVAANHIDDPLSQPEAGTLLKIIRTPYVKTILTKIGQNE